MTGVTIDKILQGAFVVAVLFICFVGGGVAAHFNVFPFNLMGATVHSAKPAADSDGFFSLPN